MLKLKLQYFGHLMWRTNSLEKTLMLGNNEDRRGQQRMRWLDDITDSVDMSFCKLRDSEGQGSLVCYSPWGRKELDMTERLNWNSCFSKIKVYIFLTSVLVHKEWGLTHYSAKISRTHIFTRLRSCHPSRKRELAYAKWLSHLYSRMQDTERKESTGVQQLSFKNSFGRESHTPAYTLLARTTTQLHEART